MNQKIVSALLVAALAVPLIAGAAKKKNQPPSAVDTSAPAKVAAPDAGPTGPMSLDTSRQRQGQLSAEEEARQEAADKKGDEEIEELKGVIKQLPPDSGQKADLIFQLAELYYGKHKYLYAKEMRAFFAAQDANQKKIDRGEKVTEPKEDHKGSDLWRQESLRLYTQILKEFPTYERKDEVLFTLAYNQYEDPKTRDTAVQNYWNLIKQFPQSKLVPDAYVQLGEHFFNTNQLEKARRAYSEALKSNSPKVYSFALYKLAWCDFNVQDYQGSIKKLKEVIEYTEKQAGQAEGKKDRIQLKTEALNDMVLPYTQVEASDEAIAYFEANTTKKKAHKLIQKLAAATLDAGKHETSVKIYHYLINADPNDVDAPSYQNAIVHAYENERKRDMVAKEMKILVDSYGPKSPWADANKDNKPALASAYEETETAMRTIVTEYHQEAQRTKDVATYKLARDIYKQYLDSFSDSEQAFNLRYYYAEILWALNEYEPAAEQYTIELDANPGEYGNKEYKKTSAYDTILCYEKLANGQGGKELSDTQKIDEKQKKGQVAKVQIKLDRHAADAKEEEIPKWEAKLVEACDRYVKVAPGNSDEIDVRYKAAFIFYTHRHDVEAANRFGDIINKWPTNPSSRKAADLTLDILNTKKQWADLNHVAREFYANKKLIGTDRDFTSRLAALVEGSQYNVDEDLYKVQKKPAEAAVAFRGFVKEFPKSQYAPQALLYAMVIFQDANQLDQGIAVGNQLLKDFPDSRLAPRTQLYLGSFYDKTAQYAASARAYEAYVKLWEKAHGLAADEGGKGAKKGAAKVVAKAAKKPAPKPVAKGKGAKGKGGAGVAVASAPVDNTSPTAELDEHVADALFNAALWHEGMGEDDKAIAEYEKYVDYCTKKEPGFDKKTDYPEVFFNTGLIHEKAKNYKAAAGVYEAYVTRFGKEVSPSRVFYAKYKQMVALREIHPPTGNGNKLYEDRDVSRLMDELNKSYAKLDSKAQAQDDVLDGYAHVRFLMLEPMWKEFAALNFKDVKRLAPDLKEKAKLRDELVKGYTDVLATHSGEWGIAALTKIGLAWEDFSHGLIDSPDPKGLTDDQLQMYRSEIENKALPMEDTAVEALQKAIDKSFELNIYNAWTIKAEDETNKVRPGAFSDVRPVTYRGSEVFATAPLLADAAPSSAAAAPSEAPAAAPDKAEDAKPAAEKPAADKPPADKSGDDKPAAEGEGAGGN